MKELIIEYDKLAKAVDEAINNPDISFSDGIESMRVYLEFLNDEYEKKSLKEEHRVD